MLERQCGCVGRANKVEQRTFTRRLFRDGSYIALAGFLTVLSANGVLILFRALRGADEQLGVVALFVQATTVLIGVATAFSNALLPALARQAKQSVPQHTLLHVVLVSPLLLGAVASLILLLLGDGAIAGIFGAGFDMLTPMQPLLGLLVTPILWLSLVSRLSVVRQSTGNLLKGAMAGSAVAVVVAPSAIELAGVTGALMTILLAYLTQAVVLTGLAGRDEARRARASRYRAGGRPYRPLH